MTDEIRQDGKTVLKSEDGFSIPMFSITYAERTFQETSTGTISSI